VGSVWGGGGGGGGGGGQTRCIVGNAKVVNGYFMLILNRAAKEFE